MRLHRFHKKFSYVTRSFERYFFENILPVAIAEPHAHMVFKADFANLLLK